MYCSKCGSKVSAASSHCHCGHNLNRSGNGAAHKNSADLSSLSVISFVCSILIFFTCGMTTFPAILFGHIALMRIRRKSQSGRGLAVSGLAISYSMVLLLFLIIGVVTWAGVITDNEPIVTNSLNVDDHQNYISDTAGCPDPLVNDHWKCPRKVQREINKEMIIASGKVVPGILGVIYGTIITGIGSISILGSSGENREEAKELTSKLAGYTIGAAELTLEAGESVERIKALREEHCTPLCYE